ncbi:MAG: type II toxin-antitoxin system HicB family antitoxin [Solirubrobacterales bacterium]
MADLEVTVRFEEVEDGWVMASVVEMPGVHTQGESYEAARENILDALRTVLSVKAELDGSEAGEPGVTIENLSFALTA